MADINASINVQLALGADVYTINLSLPSSTPTAALPFLFGVTSLPATPPPDAKPDQLLAVAIGGTGQVYVAVAPPQSLLVTAGVGDLVKQLNVVVAEGVYDPAKHQFIPPA